MDYSLPGTVTIRGVEVRKQREGDYMRYTAKGKAGIMITTCQIRDGWKVIDLLVDAASENRCPHCGRGA